MRNIGDLATWNKVIFPVTDELVGKWAAYLSPLRLAAYGGLLTAIASAAIAVVRKRSLIPLFAFLTGWFFIALLPTFQILHIFPNLVGSRLFFLSSAPLCMLVASSLICAAETIAHRRVALSVTAMLVLAIAVQWFLLLQVNLEPWLEAGRRMSSAMNLAHQVAAATAHGDKVLFADLPADYKGAGLIARPEYLGFMLKPPLSAEDLSDRIDTCERPIPGPNAFVFPAQFESQVNRSRQTYIWNESASVFKKWTMPTGMENFDLSDERSVVDADVNGTRWFFHKNVNPLRLRAVQVKFAEPVKTLGRITLIWSAPDVEWWQAIVQPVFADEHTITFMPSRLRVWTFASSIDAVGLQGGGQGHLLSARSVDIRSIEPQIEVSGTTIKVDGSSIPGCRSVRIFVAKPGQSFSDFATGSTPDSSLVESSFELPDARGETKLPASLSDGSTVSAVCAQALDEDHQPLGILSEVVGAHR
jgi:hypothetical protein